MLSSSEKIRSTSFLFLPADLYGAARFPNHEVKTHVDVVCPAHRFMGITQRTVEFDKQQTLPTTRVQVLLHGRTFGSQTAGYTHNQTTACVSTHHRFPALGAEAYDP